MIVCPDAAARSTFKTPGLPSSLPPVAAEKATVGGADRANDRVNGGGCAQDGVRARSRQRDLDRLVRFIHGMAGHSDGNAGRGLHRREGEGAGGELEINAAADRGAAGDRVVDGDLLAAGVGEHDGQTAVLRLRSAADGQGEVDRRKSLNDRVGRGGQTELGTVRVGRSRRSRSCRSRWRSARSWSTERAAKFGPD